MSGLVKAEYCRNAGLGNKLFPWARGVVFAQENNFRMIDPIWFSPRGAAVTRGGINYAKAIKKIWLYNNFIKRATDVSTFKNLLLSKNTFISCSDLNDANNQLALHKNADFLFRWNTNHDFADLLSHRALITAALNEIAHPKSKAFVQQQSDKAFIGINIRTGKDFINKHSNKKGYLQTEMDWFVEALREIRKTHTDLPALVVSDGGNNELKKILEEPNTTLLDSSNAIEDLLVLSHSTILLGSGNSTFSAWASFLGGMETYSSESTPFNKFVLPNTKVM